MTHFAKVDDLDSRTTKFGVWITSGEIYNPQKYLNS